MSANDQKSGKKKSKKKVQCYNCKKHGHYKSECWAPGGGREGQGPQSREKPKQSAAAASEWKDESWYTIAGDSLIEAEDGSVQAPLPRERDEDKTFSELAAMFARDQSAEDQVVLFDSGATRHMSCYREKLVDFVEIEPWAIHAADNHVFKAIGKGDMYVSLPNGSETTRMLLRDILYALTMGVTLVSISRITLTGATVTF
ncbi:hypothetical protein ACG7TL_004935 [Trametes sanguinea]